MSVFRTIGARNTWSQWARRCGTAALFSFTVLQVTCAPNSSDGRSSADAIGTAAKSNLKDFDYELDPVALSALGSRIGCAAASQYMRYPTSHSLKKAITTLATSGRGYDAFLSELADAAATKEICEAQGFPQVKDPVAGMKHLYRAATQADDNAGLTVVLVGGFGGHLDVAGPIDASMRAWRELASDAATRSRGMSNAPVVDAGDPDAGDPNAGDPDAGDPDAGEPDAGDPRNPDGPGSTDLPGPGAARGAGADRSLRLWRFDCTNSYASDDQCSQELVDFVAAQEKKDPSTFAHRYFFWGFSKGGNTALQALGQSPELREKTLALFTLAAPIGGSVSLRLRPEQVAKAMESQFGQLGAISDNLGSLLSQAPIAYLLGEHDSKNLEAKASDALTHVSQILDGAQSMSIETRADYLKGLKALDYTRKTGGDIPVYHAAGAIDLSILHPLPDLTVANGELRVENGTHTNDDLRLLVFAPLFVDFPLNDSCVALEHSVIPRAATPAGLQPSFVALLALDHLRMRMHAPIDGAEDDEAIPAEAITDALIETVAAKLEGSIK